ncbi:MAG: rhomboid family intramembrane serine protease [Isosphaeraceae bacterium]
MEEIPPPPTFENPATALAVAACDHLRGKKGVHVAPDIPEAVLRGAAKTYLRLAPDETLLAVVDKSNGGAPASGFALTSKRLCWFRLGPAESSLPGNSQDLAEYLQNVEKAPPYARSVPYERLHLPLQTKGFMSRGIVVNEAVVLKPGLDRRVVEAIADAIHTVAWVATKGQPHPDMATSQMNAAFDRLPAVHEQSARARAIVSEVSSFDSLVKQATPRLVVTPLVAAACVLVYGAMVVQGVSPIDPDTRDLYRLGGNNGAAVALDREYWRLFTMVFLHGGLLHLAFNLWCLVSSGPLIERLFGNVGFALLFVLSGIGGALASAWWHPMVVGVGASGAIFGILGGMLAFLLLHQHAIPRVVLEPLRSGVLAMVGYNIFFGLRSPTIDNAAHIGGLATGFVAGLALARRWPARGPFDGVTRQLTASAFLAVLLGLCGHQVLGRIRADPEVARFEREFFAPVENYNTFIAAVQPRLKQFDSINERLDQFLDKVGDSAMSPDERQQLEELITEARNERDALAAVAAPDEEIATIRGHFEAAQKGLHQSLLALRAAETTGNSQFITAPHGFNAERQRTNDAVKTFSESLKEYLAKHQLSKAP